MNVKHSAAAFERQATERGAELQSYGTVVRRPIALDERTRTASVNARTVPFDGGASRGLTLRERIQEQRSIERGW